MFKRVCLCFILFTLILNFSYSESIMPVTNIKKGMRAIGYTVLEGARIDSFDVEILKVIKGENGIKNFILGKVYGNAIKQSGGISEGMSGSPIYIGGRIIGALSYSLDTESKNIAVITPIQEMIDAGEEGLDIYRMNHNLRPGSAISVTPVRGDVVIDNIGTLTYLRGSKFYALGHQMDGKGNMKYFLNEAKIDYTVPAKDIGYKMGYSLRTIGVVTQDRKSGVSGIITNDIKTYEFSTEIQDEDGTKKYSFEMPRDIKTLQFYLSKAYEVLFKNSFDADEYRSMEYSYKILDENRNSIYESGNFIYYEDSLFENYSALIGDEILNIVDNPFKNLNFKKVEMKITLSKEKRVAYIKKLELAKDVVRIGGKLRLNIQYMVHQKNLVSASIDVEIPKDFKLGAAKLEVYSGDSSRAQEEIEPSNYNYKNLNEFLKYYRSKYKNNELIIRIESDDGEKYIVKRVPFRHAVVLKDEVNEDIIIDSMPANEVKNEGDN